MSLIKAQGAGEVSTGFYSHLLDQSLKFNEGDSSYLNRTIASAGSRTKSTFSCWFKLSGIGGSNDWSQTFYNQGNNSGSYHYVIGMYNNAIYINDYDYGSSGSPGSAVILQTNRLFRDTSAWYHLVVRIDTTQASANDRARVYINGVQETSFATQTINVSQSANMYVMNHTQSANGSTSLTDVRIGNYIANYNDGYMAEINYCDGQSLGPDSFGVTKNGIWTPIDTSGLTFGTNGFHLTFKDDVVSEGFNTVTYTGTGAAHSVSGVGFDPDFIWIKSRSNADPHELIDTLRGATKRLRLNSTNAESTASSGDGFASFDADGFTLNSDGGGGQVNGSGRTYVAWAWEAGGAPTATNSAGAGATPTAGSVKIDGSNLGSALAGSIAATKLSANTARGFSMVTYTGTGSNATVAHGLSSAPKMYWVRGLSGGGDFKVYAEETGNTTQGFLNDPAAFAGSATTLWNSTSPTSTVFSIGTNSNVNTSSATYIAYCFTDVTGYCKIGSYTGNANSSGPTVSLGFEPAWLLVKNTEASENWYIWDNTREPFPAEKNARLHPNLSVVEQTSTGRSITFSSSGFQVTGSDTSVNASGQKHLYMAFADTREAAFFKDVSGQGNHCTPINLDYRDSVPDVPTNNFCTWNPLYNKSTYGGHTYSEGNLKVTTPTSNFGSGGTTFAIPPTGKWYAEVYIENAAADVGIALNNPAAYVPGTSGSWYDSVDGIAYYGNNGVKYLNGSASSYGATFTAGDIIGIAVNTDDDEVTFYKNNSTQGAISKDATGYVFDVGDGSNGAGCITVWNFGQDSSFAGLKSTANSNADGNGHGSFAYAPPSGFLALCSQNLPDVDIIDGTEHFDTALYTGNSSTQSITSLNFSPDWIWAKDRSVGNSHALTDSVRGRGISFYTNATNAESSQAASDKDIISFDSNGFTVGQFEAGTYNANGNSMVSWNWLAGTAFSNDASATGVGTIDSSGQVNTTAGFSIISWTGIGSAGTVAHGLGATPTAIIIKNRDQGDKWIVYHQGQNASPATGYLSLNETSAFGASTSVFNNTAPTSTVFTVNTGGSVNASSEKYIAYCFTDIEGYSKHGSYVGNGNADGPFVHTGFRPAWIMQKKSNNTGHWHIWDSTRNTSNEVTRYLLANETNAEYTDGGLDILSNGFKPRKTGTGLNASGDTYIYLAFADQPFKFSNAR